MQPQNLLSYVTVRILEWRDLLKINCLRATTNTIYSKTRWWWRWRWKWHWRRGGEFCDNSTTLPKTLIVHYYFQCLNCTKNISGLRHFLYYYLLDEMIKVFCMMCVLFLFWFFFSYSEAQQENECWEPLIIHFCMR